MYCIRCGRPNNEVDTFCQVCGAVLVRPSSAEKGVDTPPLPVPSPNYFYPNGVATPMPFYPTLNYLHPVLIGAIGLPTLVLTQPLTYYSYLNQTGRVILARRAGFWVRLGASLVDGLLLGLPFFALWYFLSLSPAELRALRTFRAGATPAWLNLSLLVTSYAYYYFTLLVYGQSLGKHLLKLKVIRFDGSKPDWLTAALRQWLGYTLSGTFFLLGFLAVSWDSQKQAWHDKVARTLVVESRLLEEGRDFFLPGRTS
ncbi:MAG: RDD family protein [Chloroflexota bacterium]|nr:RDD family protein [Chloroflexota bacterium]